MAPPLPPSEVAEKPHVSIRGLPSRLREYNFGIGNAMLSVFAEPAPTRDVVVKR